MNPDGNSGNEFASDLFWPSLPYRGLDFYDEDYAALFRERDEEVAECTSILSSYNVKILILQGSSGAGKSSFLRAGLIPALKEMRGRKQIPSSQAVFLNINHGVIRCTSDPLKAIADAIISALEKDSVFVFGHTLHDGEASTPELEKHVIADRIRKVIVSIQDRSLRSKEEDSDSLYTKLAELLVDTLSHLCGSIDGKLYLVLDQAEEALTRTTSTQWNNPASSGFFHFLDEAYVRNLALRIIISVRTEYYGRFRDALRISDDRLGRRPDAGGLEPFLLRPIRRESALTRAFEFPTKVTSNGQPIYPFTFSEGVLQEVVRDVLSWRELGKASVTPLISMACSYLHSRLKERQGVINKTDYPGIETIIKDYVSNGLRQIAAKKESTWLDLLYNTLVSRQGGGTVVSLIEDAEAFSRQARRNKLNLSDQEIADTLILLTQGSTPLLRGEPADKPVHFSLQHDAMAVRLDRWQLEHKTLVERRKTTRLVMAALAATILIAIGVLSAWTYKVRLTEARSENLQAKSVLNTAESNLLAGDLRASFAARTIASDYAQSLRLLLASALKIPPAETNGGGKRNPELEKIYDDAREGISQSLREVIVRTPWFAGRYRSAGFDPISKKLVVLRSGQLFVMSLATAEANKGKMSLSNTSLAEWSDPYSLPIGWMSDADTPIANPTIGFLASAGPALYLGGNLFVWEGPTKPPHRLNLRDDALIRSLFGANFPPIAEFAGGSLVLRKITGPNAQMEVVQIRIDRDQQSNSWSVNSVQVPLPKRAAFLSWSDAEPTRFAMLDNTPSPPTFLCKTHVTAPPQGECALRRLALPPPSDKQEYKPFKKVQLYIGVPARKEPVQVTVGSAYSPPVPDALQAASPLPYTYAFVSSTNKVAVIGQRGAVSIYDSDSGASASPSVVDKPPMQITITGHGRDTKEFQKGVSRIQALQLAQSTAFWQSSLFAPSFYEGGTMLAWNSGSGFWVAATTPNQPFHATPIVSGTLLSGDPGGTVLRFVNDGSELVLLQQPRFGGSVNVRIWDMRSSWRTWVLNRSDSGASIDYLVRLACNILVGASDIALPNKGIGDGLVDPGNRWVKETVDFSDYEFDLFKINDPNLRTPCFHLEDNLKNRSLNNE
jgi:hypothetical protein